MAGYKERNYLPSSSEDREKLISDPTGLQSYFKPSPFDDYEKKSDNIIYAGKACAILSVFLGLLLIPSLVFGILAILRDRQREGTGVLLLGVLATIINGLLIWLAIYLMVIQPAQKEVERIVNEAKKAQAQMQVQMQKLASASTMALPKINQPSLWPQTATPTPTLKKGSMKVNGVEVKPR